MAILESNTDLDVKGRVLATTVPNSTGSIVTWNASTKVFGLRSNAQIISDLGLQSSLSQGNHINITGNVISVKPTLNTWIEDSGNNNRILMSTVSSGTNHNDMVLKQISSDGYFKLRNAQDEDFFVYKNNTQELMMPLVGTSSSTVSNILMLGSNGAIWKSNRTIGDFALANGSNLTSIQTWRNSLGIGVLNDLTTTDKSNLVNAINEVNGSVGNVRVRNYAFISNLLNNSVVVDEDGFGRYIEGHTSAFYQVYFTDHVFEPNTTYTLFFRGYAGNTSQRFIIHYTDGTNDQLFFVTSLATRTLVTPAHKTVDYISFTYGSSTTVRLYDILFVEGTHFPGWIPAPEDQVSDWNQTNPLLLSYIKNKPTIPTSSDYITTNTTQTGLSGNKTTSGVWNFISSDPTSINVIRTSSINSSIGYGVSNSVQVYTGLADSSTFAIGDGGGIGNLNTVSNRWMWVDNTGRVTSQNGFAINGQSDSSILLAGGGHRPVSDFALASSIITPNNGLLTISTSSDLTGGGTFSADQATASNVSIGLSSGTLASLALANTAVQPSALNNYYQSGDVNIPAKGGDYRVFPNNTASSNFDLNDIQTPGFYYRMTSSSNPNNPKSGGYFYIETHRYASSANNITQYAHPYRVSDGKWMRNRYGGTWTDWVEFIHSGNLASYANTLLTGFVPTSRTITINGTTFDLSANRTWDIPVPSQVNLIQGAGISVTGTYPNLTITNTAPNVVQTLSLGANAGQISLSGGGGDVRLQTLFTVINRQDSNVRELESEFRVYRTNAGNTNYPSTSVSTGFRIERFSSASSQIGMDFNTRGGDDEIWYKTFNQISNEYGWYQIASREWITAQGYSTTDTITRLRGTTSGTYTSGDLTLLAGTNVSIVQSGSDFTINATNTNTTYTAGTGLSLTGTTFGQTITTSGTGSFVTGITQTTNGFQVNLGTPPNTTSNLALGTRTATTMPITNSGGTGVTLPIATTALAGLLSGADKTKLDGIATGANNYVHPNSGVTAGTYNQVTVDAQGHVTAGNNQPYQTNTQVNNAINNAIQPLVDGVDYHHLNTGGHVPIEKKKTIVNIPAGSLGYTINVDDAPYEGYELAINGCGEWSVTVNGSIMDKCGNTDSITLGGNQGALFWWSVDLGMWVQAI